MNLPSALRPWASQLSIFPDEISIALGMMAQRIAPFVGHLSFHDDSAHGDPDGYDGVSRRGIYERLLLSELSIADELSDEFIRRAVMGEHLFLKLARVSPTAKRISIALFNAGPDQLGTPRIAHLAALIVLARRAESARAEFAWGILQDDEMCVFYGVNESSVMSLINGRTSEALRSEHIRKWREKLVIHNQDVSDFWIVGADKVHDLEESKGFSLLCVEDVLEPETRRVRLSVKSASGAEKETTLELPEDSVSTRVLRNPFEFYKLPEKGSVTTRLGSFFFDENGGKIFARHSGDEIVYFPVPNSPNAALGSPRKYKSAHPNELLLAAGRLGKSIAMISLTESGDLRLKYPKFGNFRLPEGNYLLNAAELVLPGDDFTLLPIYNLRYPNSPFFQAAFRDAKDNLFVLTKASDIGSDRVGRAFLTATEVLTCARTENRFVFVGLESDRADVTIVSYGEETMRREVPIRASKAFFGRGKAIAHKTFGLLAVGDNENRYVIIQNDGDKHVDATGEVVGVFYDPSFASEVGLVELGDDRRTLSFNVGRQHSKHIFSSEAEIAKIVFSHSSPVCAYQTTSGEITVFSLTHRVPIARFGG